MNQKEEKGKTPPSPNPAMAFDPTHLLGMHSMAAAGLPYAPLTPFPSPYSLLGQPPHFHGMFGGLNLNPMANPLHAAALSHSLAAASLYGLPKQSGDLGSPPPPHLLPPSSSATASSSSSSSANTKKGKSSSKSIPPSAHTPPSNSPSPSHLAHHSSASSTPTFSPFDSAAAAAAAAMNPYLPGWALNGSAYHMTQLANQMAEAQKRSNQITESHHSSRSSSASSSHQQPTSSSTPSSSSSSLTANRGKSRSSKTTTNNSSSSNNVSSISNNNNTSTSGSSSSNSSSNSRKILPAHQHHHENKNSRRSSSSSPHPSHNTAAMLNIPLSASTESKKSSSSSAKLQVGEGMEFDPRSMITPYQLSPELAYLSQSLLLHRPDLASLHAPFMTASTSSASSSSATAANASGTQPRPSSSSSSSTAEVGGLEPGQLHSSSSSSSSLKSKRKKEESRTKSEHQNKESEIPQHSSSHDVLSSSNLPYDLSQSSEQHSMDNIRKKKIADQIRKRMAGGGSSSSASGSQPSHEQQQQLEQLQQHQAALDAVGAGLGLDLFAAAAAAGGGGGQQYGLRQADWLEYLAKERSRLGSGKSSTQGQGRESGKEDRLDKRSLEASLQQQEEEFKELQKKYALAMVGTQDGVVDLQKRPSHLEGETSSSGGKEADIEMDKIGHSEGGMTGSESDGSGRETPKRGSDSVDSGSPVKKRCYQTDERELVIPLEHGWNRQTVINGMGRRGIVGDVYYFAPCGKKLKTIPDVMRYLERNPNSDLARENFSFNTKVNVGQFYEVRGGLTSAPVPLSDTEVLERIEMSRGKRARMQMLARKKREKVAREQALARQIMENKLKRKLELQALSRQKEKEMKQQERMRLQEQLRKEKELRAQQIIEARNRRQQELEEMRMVDTVKRNQEKELKRQQLVMLKEQERERRRQHILLIKALEQRKKQEEKQNKERMREEKLNEKLKLREIRMSQRKVEMEVAQELKKPVEDMELKNRKILPEFPRLDCRMAGRPIADCMMVVEFLNNFGSALNLEKGSIPTLQSLENGLMGDSEEEVEEVMSLVMHLLRFAIDDVGVSNPKEAVTKLNQKITEMEMTDSTMSEVLRIFIKARGDKQLSETLREKPMEALNSTHKAAILAFLCNELLTSKVVTSEIDKHMESINNLRRDKWIVEGQLRQLRVFQAKKFNKIHRSTMDRRRNNSSSNNSMSEMGVGGDDSVPPGKLTAGSDDDDDDKEEDEGSGNESDGSTSAPMASTNTNLNMPFEPVDETLTVEESDKRIENLRKQHLAYRQKVFRSSLRLRAINIGQDRYKRTYWILPLTGGVYVEGMESGEPEDYVEENERKIKMEVEAEEEKKRKVEEEEERVKREKEKGECVKEEENSDVKDGDMEEGKEGEKKENEGVEVKEEEDDDACGGGDKENESKVVEGKLSKDEDDERNEITEEKSLPMSVGEAGVKEGEAFEGSEKKGVDDGVMNAEDVEDDVIMEDGDEDDDDDDSNLNNNDEDEDDDDDDDENDIGNMTGISENASWTDSDFNDSNLSYSGVRTSGMKVTVDMNGHGEEEDVCDSHKKLPSFLENGAGVSGHRQAVTSSVLDNKQIDVEKSQDSNNIVAGGVNSGLKNDSEVAKIISESSNEKCSPVLHPAEKESSFTSVVNGKLFVDFSKKSGINNDGCEAVNDTDGNKNVRDAEIDNGDVKNDQTNVLEMRTKEDVNKVGLPDFLKTVKQGENVKANDVRKVNGFADDQKTEDEDGRSCSDKNVDCSNGAEKVDVFSVDMTLSKVEKDTRLNVRMDDEFITKSGSGTASAVCVDLSKTDVSFKKDSILASSSPVESALMDGNFRKSYLADKALPAADILRVPKIAQRESSLFSMLNHHSTRTKPCGNSSKPQELVGENLSMLSSKAKEKEGSFSSKVSAKPVSTSSSILSSSLLFSPSSLSPLSSSSSLLSPSSNTELKMSSASSLSINSSSTHSSKVKGLNGNLQDSTTTAVKLPGSAPRPAHSKPVNQQTLPPFHPSAMVNPCLGQTPPAAHSSHTGKKRPPLHLTFNDMGPPPSRPSPSHFHQTPPHSFNNPALPVSPYGDSSASQALSSLASFASPPPAHQHRSASSSLLTSTPKLLTSTTTATNTTTAASSSSKSFKAPPPFSIIDEVLKNEPEYSSSQLLHHAASQVRRSGGERDVPSSSLSSSSSSSSASKAIPLSKMPLTSSELSSLITSAVLSSSSSSSPSASTLATSSYSDSDSKEASSDTQNPMWFSLLPRTPCDELSLTRRTATVGSNSPSPASNSTQLSAANLLLNSSTSVTSLLNSMSTSSASGLSLENLLSLLQSNSPLLTQETIQQSLNLLSSSSSPTPFSGGADGNDFKVPQPPLDSTCSSPVNTSTTSVNLNYDPWDILRAAQGERQLIPANKQHGWWRIYDLNQMKKMMTCTMNRGIREKNLQRAVQRYLDYARGHVTFDSSIGETDPNLDNSSKSSNNLKRKLQDKSPSCSPVKKEKKTAVQENDDNGDTSSHKEEAADLKNDDSSLNNESSRSEIKDKENELTEEQQNKKGSNDDDALPKTDLSNSKEEEMETEVKEGGEENKKDATIHVKKEVLEEGEVCSDEKKEGKSEEEEEVIDFVLPDKADSWSVDVMHEIEMAAVEDVEALEDRIYHASLQAKSGWKPNRETGLKMVDRAVKEAKDDESYPLDAGISRLLELEANVERRYLKPPLSRSVSLNMSSMASSSTTNSNDKQDTSCSTDLEEEEDVPPGLMLWRQAVIGSESPAQLSLCTQLLSKSISWEKSIMRVICQNCRKDDNEAELLLCDGCDKGFHTYCFKPKMENIPEGDWYCFECVSKASGTPHCGLCGAKGGRLAHCSKCPRYVHLDCLDPPLPRVPKRWQCANCLCDKAASKRSRKRKDSVPTIQRITKLVVKEEPADADDFYPGEVTPSATPPPQSTPPSSFVKEELKPSNSRNASPAQKSQTSPGGRSSNNSNDAAPTPEKKRRKRKEKAAVEQKTPPVPPQPLIVPSSSPVNTPIVSSPTPTPSPATPKKKDKRQRKERKTKVEKKKEESEAGQAEKGGVSANVASGPVDGGEKEKTKDLNLCSKLVGELESHELGWPFLKPVNRKHFPLYKKYIKTPMDFTTIRNKVKVKGYKHRQDFAADVRLVFNNCETFNEDESEVGQAGHNLRQYFESRWLELFPDDGV